ncbi:MAG: hypothetical protein PHP25_04880 [Candidatus Moranbacteria bacterium]|nr:hypothetical protein [Candidatus Moranbacteria bacterium]
MKRKKTKKIKLNPFQKVKFDPESAETMLLVLLCAGFFGVFSFASGKILFDYKQKEGRIAKNVLAAESQKDEDLAGDGENILPEGVKVSETMSVAARTVESQASRVTTARKKARQRAAEIARILSGPVPTGPTTGLSDGRRVCAGHSDHPQRGGAVHMDEDCCADYNETPNPRCYYPPGKMGILKGH